ncbi:unnamed protein product [Effrenium voratum]|uniref:Magnesium transporter n=1 Tax=Effrenium voratum TaxID=2562239 RepID=A0AA36IKH2_9DINO|nr:unnamed protein product [Effrenium voratum]
MELHSVITSPATILATYKDVLICVVASALAGVGVGFFGCLLSSADKQRQLNGGKHTERSRIRFILGAIGSTIFGVLSLVGLAYGPVALVVVVRAGATLPANALFSQVFHLRPLTSSDALGTLVTLSGVVCFTLFQGDPGPEVTVSVFMDVVARPVSIAWNTVLVVATLAAVLYMMKERIQKRSCLLRRSRRLNSSGLWPNFHHGRFWRKKAQPQEGEREEREEEKPMEATDTRRMCNQDLKEVLAVCIVTSCSSAEMDVAAKGWAAALKLGPAAALESALFWISVVVNVIFLVGMRVGTIIGCHRCDVLLFIPISTVLNIFVSVATGLVVLEEWQQVDSWTGLASSSLTVLGGIIMLVTGPAEAEASRVESSEEESETVEEESTSEEEAECGAVLCGAVEVDTDEEGQQRVFAGRSGTVSVSELLVTTKMHALANMNLNHSRAAWSKTQRAHGPLIRESARWSSAPNLQNLLPPESSSTD